MTKFFTKFYFFQKNFDFFLELKKTIDTIYFAEGVLSPPPPSFSCHTREKTPLGTFSARFLNLFVFLYVRLLSKTRENLRFFASFQTNEKTKRHKAIIIIIIKTIINR